MMALAFFAGLLVGFFAAWCQWRRHPRTVIGAPAGWSVVPDNATQAQLDAAMDASMASLYRLARSGSFDDIGTTKEANRLNAVRYEAMLAAAPFPQTPRR